MGDKKPQPGRTSHVHNRRVVIELRGAPWRLSVLAVAVVAIAAASGQTLPALKPHDASGLVTYFVDEGRPRSQYKPTDRQLAVWALQAWERSARGALRFASSTEDAAQVRVYWVPAMDGQYGEMRTFSLDGRPASAVFIRPDIDALDPELAHSARLDPLMRDTIVYLTCLHELGHALGLTHTASFEDVMYYFGYGGDIPTFFTRYRAQLQRREDIGKVSGLSAADVERLSRLYPTPP
jgi:hypothetical protein